MSPAHMPQAIATTDALFLMVLRGVFLEGTPFHLLMPQFWPLAVIGVITLAIAGWLFHNRLF